MRRVMLLVDSAISTTRLRRGSGLNVLNDALCLSNLRGKRIMGFYCMKRWDFRFFFFLVMIFQLFFSLRQSLDITES